MQGTANTMVKKTDLVPDLWKFHKCYLSFSHGDMYLLCSDLYLETSISVKELSKNISVGYL